jgi:hypothetical protein
MVEPTLGIDALDRLREALQQSRTLVASKTSPDEKDKEETVAAREAKAKADAAEEANRDSASNRTLRERYAKWVFRYLIGYSLLCFLLLLADGFHWWAFDLPDSVLEYLVGSTAAAAIGLVLAVTHGLFKR